MSALPRFFFITTIAGLALWLVQPPAPFPLLGMFIFGSSVCGLLLSLAYVHAFMPAAWQRMISGPRRLLGVVDSPVRPAYARAPRLD
ncbi:MAG: hypothetical protein M3Z31_10375 [Pseudomonadota bacterium]|nr:hypothetical protein [Pseudomonadota bacterium]